MIKNTNEKGAPEGRKKYFLSETKGNRERKTSVIKKYMY